MGVLEWLVIAILAVVAIVLIFFGAKIVIFLFSNWIISRALSAICSIGAFVAGILCYNDTTDNPAVWPLLIFSVLAYMFALGSIIFDTEFDGWEITSLTYNYAEFRMKEAGGFFGNLAIAIVIVCVGYFLLAMMMPPFYFIIPILLFLLNAVLFVVGLNSGGW